MSPRRFCFGGFERLAMFASLSVIASVGCSQHEPTPTPSPAANGSAHSAAPQKAAQADEAVRRALDGLRRREAKSLWEFLPPSYRRDAQQLVREAARRVDDASWEPFVQTVNKACRVLAKQSELLSAADSGGASDPAAAASITRLRRLLDAVRDSELADLKRLRTIDVEQFLDKTGGEWLSTFGGAATDVDPRGAMEDPFARFADVEIELVSSSAESAIVRVRWPGQPPSEHDFVHVEGHWLPRTLAESWPAQISAVREQCLAWADHLREHPEDWHAQLRDIDQMLDKLDAAKTPTDARKVWQEGIARILMTWSPAKIPNTKSAESSAPKPSRGKQPDTEVLLPDDPVK